MKTKGLRLGFTQNYAAMTIPGTGILPSAEPLSISESIRVYSGRHLGL
jgi:hypothetical protein